MIAFANFGIGVWIFVVVVVGVLLIPTVIVPTIARMTEKRRKAVPVPILGGKLCTICLDGYPWDKKKHEFDEAVANFLSLEPSALQEAEGYVFQYYKDCEEDWKACDEDFKPIESPRDVWRHVRFGSQPTVSRRRSGDMGVYVSVECSCDWEEEHGLQIVFRNGLKVTKVGSYDGHLTNADAFGDDSLEEVIYKA